jgi:hypothetical protein
MFRLGAFGLGIFGLSLRCGRTRSSPLHRSPRLTGRSLTTRLSLVGEERRINPPPTDGSVPGRLITRFTLSQQ